MKLASWCCCVLVFGSSEEPVFRPEETIFDVPCSFVSEFVVGRATSDDEVFGALIEIPSSLRQYCACIGKPGSSYHQTFLSAAAADAIPDFS